MKYTKDFTSRVLSVVRDSKIKDDIKNAKLDLGDYLQENAFKGIDSKVILECLDLNNLNYLYQLAIEQEKTKALYQEWFDYYVMKCGERSKQEEIDMELNQHHFLSEEYLKGYKDFLNYVRKYHIDKDLIQRIRKK